jgi:hypothetical protein
MPIKQSILSISSIKSSNRNINRITPSFKTLSILEKQQDLMMTDKASRKKAKKKIL